MVEGIHDGDTVSSSALPTEAPSVPHSEQAHGGDASAAEPPSASVPFISAHQVAATVFHLMEAHPTAGTSLLTSWTARILGLGVEAPAACLELVRGIVHGERLAATRQMRVAQVALVNDSLGAVCGAFHALCADISSRSSRPLEPADVSDNSWQLPDLLSIDYPIVVDDD